MRTTVLILFLLLAPWLRAQDTLWLSRGDFRLNVSETRHFTLYESAHDVSVADFLGARSKFNSRTLKNPIENLDFTTGTFFIDFVLVNPTDQPCHLVLETARPITNVVALLDTTGKTIARSGDAMPFSMKDIPSNRSALPIHVPAHNTQRFILKLSSDGEIISLPMTFWDAPVFEQSERTQQFLFGIFYGVFIFVIIIYFTFYVLLRDSLFLLYTTYVFFSGMLQFVLDGYGHQYLFQSGGYFTQHQVIVVAGLTVFFALLYAVGYLELTGRLKKITLGFAILVMVSLLSSLIPGKLYEIGYPMINGFSFLAVLFLFLIAIRIRRINPGISPLFLLGLFTLMTGAVIFILGNFSVIDIPALTQNSLKAGTLFEIICLSILMAGKYKTLQEEKQRVQALLVAELEEKNRMASETNIRLEQEVAERTKEIESQRALLKEKNDDIVSSIKYAERIQKAVLSNEDKFKSILPDSFVIYYPKDIVSGDFFWIERISTSEATPKGLIVYATADCTGHGVPGAFVSIICNNLLKLGKTNKDVNTPGEALDFANEEINRTLNSEFSNEQIRDGMDIALCAIDPDNRILHFAGAKNSAYVIRKGELIELKADRQGIGYTDQTDHKPFTTHSLPLQSGDMIYTFSDGFPDQFGGPEGKKYTTRRLRNLLLSIAAEPLEHQRSTLENSFDIWKDNTEQLDDVLLIGVRIP